jgi:hypothetical protein
MNNIKCHIKDIAYQKLQNKYQEAPDLCTSHTCDRSGDNRSLFSYLATLYVHVRKSTCEKILHRGLGLVSRRMRWTKEGMGYGWGEEKQSYAGET